MNSASAQSKLEKGSDGIKASDTSGPRPRSPGVSAHWHHFKNPSQPLSFRGRMKKNLFSPNKGECLKKAGNYTLAWRLGVGIRWYLKSLPTQTSLILWSMRQIIIIVIIIIQEKTLEYPGIPVGFAQGQECGDGFAGTWRRCLCYP